MGALWHKRHAMPKLPISFLVLFVAASGWFACKGDSGPSDAALKQYVERHKPAPDAAVAPPKARAASRIRVTVVKGTGLPDTDDGPGETDPYVKLEYEGERYKTSVAEGTLEPVWGDSFIIDFRDQGVLTVTLMDHDSFPSADEKLGVRTEPIDAIAPGEKRSLELKFREGKQGTLTLELQGLE